MIGIRIGDLGGFGNIACCAKGGCGVAALASVREV